jgi:DNA-binding MarR family transcriptional regulator
VTEPTDETGLSDEAGPSDETGPSEQELLSGLALATFALNGRFLELAETLARPVGLTAAWWQVLGAVLPGPLPVAGIAREMGVTRQSVQRIADLLVEKGYAEYRDNPAHRRAKLVCLTDAGLTAMQRIGPAHAEAAGALAAEVGREELARALTAIRTLTRALDGMAEDGASRS